MTNEAKNLFVMCAAYYLTYLPVVVNLALRSMGLRLPDAVKFAITWIYVSSSAVNGFLYIALHSSVRRELRRYLPRCRHTPTVAPLARPVGDGCGQRHLTAGGTNTGTSGAPATAMTSHCQHVTERLPTVVL